MTNTLHRYGSAENLQDDYIVFAIPARGLNDALVLEMQRRFLQIALKHTPVNIGDATQGAAFRPSKNLNPSVHWRREMGCDFDEVVNSVSGPTTVAAVFDNPANVTSFI